MNQLLLVEDDPLLGEGLQQYLQSHGFSCRWVTQAKHVEQYWFQTDLVILDRQLPDGDSLSHLPDWLAKKAIPVIILTAKTELDDRIDGLNAGARDYILKPFAHEELLARIHVQLRPLGDAEISFHDLKMNLSTRTTLHQGVEISLKPKEFQLLALLVKNPNRVYHRDELLNKVWGHQAFPSTRTVDNHILHLRQKIPNLNIETLRGIGYRLKGNV